MKGLGIGINQPRVLFSLYAKFDSKSQCNLKLDYFTEHSVIYQNAVIPRFNPITFKQIYQANDVNNKIKINTFKQ